MDRARCRADCARDQDELRTFPQGSLMPKAWIGVNWGRTRLQVWAMSGQSHTAAVQSDRGRDTTPPEAFEAALLDLVTPWLGAGRLSVLACGTGLAHAPARQSAKVPCLPLSTPPTLMPNTDPRLRIWTIPGIRQVSPPDLMEGTETRIAGFLSLNPKFDGVLCLPGAQSCWAHVSAGEIVSFQTFLTGDLLHSLSRHSVLRHSLAPEGWDAPAFLDALDQILAQPNRLAGKLFGIRAGALLDGLSPDAAAARLQGFLVGAELAAARPYWTAQQVAVVGAGRMCRPYIAALESQGLRPTRADGDSMTRAGLAAAQRLIPGFNTPI